MIPVWPLSAPMYPLMGARASVMDGRAQFSPEVGPPLQRARTSARVEMWDVSVMIQTRADLSVFEDWVAETLGQGAQDFIWRHPLSKLPTRWRLTGSPPYGVSFPSHELAEVSFEVARLPGVPWFAPYVPDDTLRLPAVVADYANDVFGVDGERTAASAVAAVAGTFDVWTYPTAGTVTIETSHAVTAGDIPATAPAGVSKIVAFVP